MSSDTKNSVSGSAPTSSSVPGKPSNSPDKRSDKKDKDYDRALDPAIADQDLTEAEYLRRQGERAKLAISGAATGIKDAAFGAISSTKHGAASAVAGAASAANPLHFVEKRPWISVAVSAVAGFLGMMWWHPNRYGKVRQRLVKLEKKLREHEKGVVEVRAVSDGKDTGKKTAAAGLGAVLLQQAMQAAKPFLADKLGPLLAGLQGHHGHAGNGHYPDPEAMGAGTAADRLDPTI